MLAIVLAIGLISAFTGKDVVGDLNSGTIIDGNGLGGIIGDSGTSTDSGSSPETSGNSDIIYKPDNVYYKDDLDIVASYLNLAPEGTSRAAVLLTFWVPGGQYYLWDIDFTYESSGDNFPGPAYCTHPYLDPDNETWINVGDNIKAGTMKGIIPDEDGFIKIVLDWRDYGYETEQEQAAYVSSFLNEEWTIKVYNKRPCAVG